MHQRREVEVDGRVIRLNEKETAVVSALLMRSVPLTIDELVSIVHPDPFNEPDAAVPTLRLVILRSRRKGVPIVSRYTFGYVIERDPTPTVDQE